MRAIVGVVLECAALGATVSLAASALAFAVVAALDARHVSRRADLAFVAALFPAVAVVVTLAAAAAPSILAALGFPAVDHCPEHAHHAHLCVFHFAGLRPAAALFGALALAVFSWRLVVLGARQARRWRLVRSLESLAVATTGGAFDVVHVPGGPRICHAFGLRRRRVLVSESLRSTLSPTAWRVVLAHEEEHLARRDPLAGLLVELALLFAPPGLARALGRAFSSASEEACDAAAARVVGDPLLVAEGLVEVARALSRERFLDEEMAMQPAATGASIERRVRELLHLTDLEGRRQLSFAGGALLVVVGAAVAVAFGPELHHALETLLFHFV